MNKSIQTLLRNLFDQKFSGAKTAFLAGSFTQGLETKFSDLDVVIIFEKIDHAYRKAFEFEGFLIDAFIHAQETLQYFYDELDIKSRMLALPMMIAKGQEFPIKTELGDQLQKEAMKIIQSKPFISKDEIDRRRFQVTDLLDDLKGLPDSTHERLLVCFELHRHLLKFFLLSQGHWIGSGKSLIRILEAVDMKMADRFFEVFKDQKQEAIESLVQYILKSHGGLFWVGFRSDAPSEFKKNKKDFEADLIQLIPASLSDYSAIQNMARFYVYDMSEYMGSEPGWEIPEDGLYECIDFKKYWESDSTASPFLIKYKDELAGFVILDKKGSDDKVDFNMAQFFILRKFKKKGLGKFVAQSFFEKFKGLWEVNVMLENHGAYEFWKKIIADYAQGDFTEERKRIKHLGNTEKNIFRFSSVKKC